MHIHITCLEIRKTEAQASNGKKKTSLSDSSKTLKILGKTTFWAGVGWQEKKQILRFSENIANQLEKQGFEHLHQVARRKTDPWSPTAQHEIARGTIKNHWKSMVFAHGHTGGNGELARSQLCNL